MMQRHTCAWILSALLLGLTSGKAQGLMQAPVLGPSAVDKSWNRLRTLMSLLVTDEGTRKAFNNYQTLGDSFSSEDHFSYFVAPWRVRLSVLPASPREAPDVEVEVLSKPNGTTTYLLTYHHQEPANAITIVQSVWLDENLLKVSFMKGFSNVPDNAGRNRKNAWEESYRQWNSPAYPVRK